MRDFLNAILTFIGATSLTDEEFDAIEGDISSTSNNEEVYTALGQVLDGREGVTGYTDRLTYYFKAKGITFASAEPTTPTGQMTTGKSNIFLGGGLF